MEQKRVAVLGDSILKGIQVDQSTNKYITLTFIPTSIEIVTLVQCACGAEIDLSPEHIFFEKLKKQKGQQ